MNSFFKKVRKQREARENPEKPYFYLPPDLLRKKVDQKKQDLRRPRKKTRAGKGVAQLGQQSQQSVPPLVVRNEYSSNLDLDVDFEELARFYEETGLDLAQVLAEGPSAPKVDP